MSGKHLSPEIVSLIHHVELNESGWWKKAVGQVVRGVLWKERSPLTFTLLQDALHREIGMRLPDDLLEKQLAILSSQGVISKMPGPNYKLTEQAYQNLSAARLTALAEQNACEAEFLANCEQDCPGLDAKKAWGEFTKALSNAIQVAGANLFHLLADGQLQKDIDWLSNFIEKFEPKFREGLRTVLSKFFSPENSVCRNQVLRHLTAHFFAEAAQLRPETLDLIDSDRKTRTIKVVLDTNFIFSVLKLHDNPADEAALSLVDIAKKSRGKLDIKLYILPSTLDEAQRVLLGQMHLVEHVRTTTAMARVAVTQPLPSIAKKFFHAAATSPGLSASNFFQPYITDLRTILRDKGIAVMDSAHPAVYHQRQDIIDDVHDELERETRLPEQRRKGYDTLLHDAVLWHAVNDRRSKADSPFEVEYWAVSIDWRLIAFDRAKRSKNHAKLPVVLHPSNLVQLIQFWIPRTPELENSLVDSLRLPLFFQSFDPEDERATVKILESISRFKNVGDLPEQTLKIVLANQALRTRLKDAEASNDEAFELVHEEILLLHKGTLEQLQATQNDLQEREKSLDVERQEREIVTKQAKDTETKVHLAEQTVQKLSAENADLIAKRSQEAENAEKQLKRALTAERTLAQQRYIGLFYILPAVMGSSLAYFTYPIAAQFTPVIEHGWQKWAFVAAIWLIPLCIAFLLSPWKVGNNQHLIDWWPVRVVHVIRKKLILAPLAAGVGAIYQGSVWDGIKNLLSGSP